ncbi:MAG: AI-2E family transporter [Candidatus Altiarchaeota archaeon]
MSRFHWVALGLVSFTLLLFMIKPFVDVLVYGVFLYYILRPLYWKVNQKMHSRDVSAGLSILAVIIPLILLMWYMLDVATTEIRTGLDSIDDPLGDRVDRGLSIISASINSLNLEDVARVIRENQDLGKFVLSLSKSTLGVAFRFVLVFAVAFYLLKYGSDVKSWFLTTINTEKERNLTDEFFDDIDNDLHHVFYGNILVAFVTAVLGIIVLVGVDMMSPTSKIDVPYPILLGVLCGIANLIPIVGMKIIWIPLVIYITFNAYVGGALVSYVWFLVLSGLAIYVIVDWFPDMVLRPYLSGSERIPMGVLFFTYVFGASVFGFSGILIGPIVVVTSINFFRVIFPELKKRY